MKIQHFYILISVFFMVRCEDELTIDMNKDTYYDDIADICYSNDHFFTTNYDLSGNSGSQIDLIRFTPDGTNVDDAFELGMNGQGYLAMTGDGSDIYMQSRSNGAIIKSSLIGERAYMKWDSVDVGKWFSSGICYLPDRDSLLLLYRNLDSRTEYRARTVSKSAPHESGSDRSFSVDFIDTTYHGIWAITYKDSAFYMLGVDTLYQDKLIIADFQFDIVSVEDIADSTVVGLCFKGDDLYLSYRPRRIEMWGSY
ncbi:hypothetical protein KJ762_14115 [bacterium]|nr:hypothetical protein [bacterium]MBU1064163.1 hypothetical protein [bacterium]MBU1635625.1 hypothetical protein [bacterium]MBU1874552.1 hypothetical protein [bacterium]